MNWKYAVATIVLVPVLGASLTALTQAPKTSQLTDEIACQVLRVASRKGFIPSSGRRPLLEDLISSSDVDAISKASAERMKAGC